MHVITDERFVVLNALYLRKMADQATLAENSGCPESVAAETLKTSEADGGVIDLGGQYMLTDEGRQAVLDYYDGRGLVTRIDASAPRDDVARAVDSLIDGLDGRQ